MRKSLYILFFLAAIIFGLSMFANRQFADQRAESFLPPDETTRMAAIGSTHDLSPSLRRALDPGDSFDPIPTPGISDWLAQHQETGQTFQQFMLGAPNRPDQTRNKLYVLPLGLFEESSSPELELLKQFAEAFFNMDVQFLPAEKLQGLSIKIREREDQQRQILSTDVLTWLTGRVPADAYCLLAITMEDLYPQESWNFVFGQASLSERVGVYSFARYSPEFRGGTSTADNASHTLMLSCKILSHETGHMFGIKHCTHFHCLMNGSNSRQESERAPLHLCPVCLRKLQSSLGFDVKERYQVLKTFSDQVGWSDESQWLGQRIRCLDRK